jgi:hypothetical protein
MKAT